MPFEYLLPLAAHPRLADLPAAVLAARAHGSGLRDALGAPGWLQNTG